MGETEVLIIKLTQTGLWIIVELGFLGVGLVTLRHHTRDRSDRQC